MREDDFFMLENINSPKDLKKLSLREKEVLAQEIRDYVLDVVSKNGGHLASNLGVVELTIALHSIFNVACDKIIWDVGHQVYIHKILTGRKDSFKTLRKLGGIAGFPKTSESPTDVFNTGHSGTSISAALGIARARDINKDDYHVIAVIGDGALTGGMAIEALNDAGCSKNNLIVILNDNEMSISPNIGGLNLFLSKLRGKKAYKKSNDSIKDCFKKIPLVGKPLVKLAQKIKRSIKSLFISKMFFEDIGFTYLGPVDGHNMENLEKILMIAKEMPGPVLIHVLTTKGKGYEFAWKNPEKFHATGAFDLKSGESISKKKRDYSAVFGEKLVNLASKNKKIVAITASMTAGTGLKAFAKKYPDRFFDIGIAEQHALGLAAGMASNGMIPVVPIYSTFYQRGYDQVIHDIAMQNLPVVMCVDRAGIVGADGETHQGLLDLAFFRLVPNLTILAPKDFLELEMMLEFAVNLKKPVVIRYPRGSEASYTFKKHNNINFGKSEVLLTGDDITIVAIGKFVSKAMEIAEILKNENINCEVINARFLKPFDEKVVMNSILKTGCVISLEDGTKINGLGTTIEELICNHEIQAKLEIMAYPDQFIRHGEVSELEKIYGLDNESIVNKIRNLIK